MKKIIFAFFPWFFVLFGYKGMAQDEMNKKSDKDKKETEEIIIRKKGSKDANITIQINGDNVLINGKPLSDFKDDEITINKRKMVVRDRNGRTMIFDNDDEAGNGNFSWNGDNNFGNGSMAWAGDDKEGGAFLGVSTEKTDDGAKITEDVSKETAAGKAGLQKGDIITKLDEQKIDGPSSLYDAVNAKKPKDEVKIFYKRDGKEKTTKAILGERKGSYSKSYSYSAPNGYYKSFTMPYTPGGDESLKNLEELESLNNLKLSLNDMTINGFPRRQKLGLKIQDTEDGNGVKILEVEDSSAAAIAGLKKDDIITEIGMEKVNNTDEARDQLQENREKATYPIKARRNGTEMNFTIKIPKNLKTTNL